MDNEQYWKCRKEARQAYLNLKAGAGHPAEGMRMYELLQQAKNALWADPVPITGFGGDADPVGYQRAITYGIRVLLELGYLGEDDGEDLRRIKLRWFRDESGVEDVFISRRIEAEKV